MRIKGLITVEVDLEVDTELIKGTPEDIFNAVAEDCYYTFDSAGEGISITHFETVNYTYVGE